MKRILSIALFGIALGVMSNAYAEGAATEKHDGINVVSADAIVSDCVVNFEVNDVDGIGSWVFNGVQLTTSVQYIGDLAIVTVTGLGIPLFVSDLIPVNQVAFVIESGEGQAKNAILNLVGP